MQNIMRSASKVVFILMAVATVAALFTAKINAEQFMVLSSMTFAFYFSNKGDVTKPYADK
jgi:hypothetical protein